MKKIFSSAPFLIILTVAFITTLFVLQKEGEDACFVRLSTSVLKQSYESDSLSMQFSFSDPRQFDLSEEETRLPVYDRTKYTDYANQITDQIAVLQALSPERLSRETRETYAILLPYLQRQLEGCKYSYFEEPLCATSGIHTSLPILLAEFPMTEESDAEKYLSVLSCIPAYFDGLLQYETDKAAAGKFMAAEDADLVISQCDFFCSEEGRNLFTETFRENLKKIIPGNSAKYQSFIQKQERMLDTQVLPAYEKLADGLMLLKENGKERRGLCQYENGNDYYEFRLRQLIGTDKSTDEIRQMLYTKLDSLYTQLLSAQKAYAQLSLQPGGESTAVPGPDAAGPGSESSGQGAAEPGSESSGQGATSRSLETSGADTPDRQDSYLLLLQDSLGSRFPYLPGSSSVTIKEIPAALRDYTAPAYYFTPSISLCAAGKTPSVSNIICISPDAEEDPLSLFTTLAHEGYPGHMFQNVYFLSKHGVSQKNVLRYSMDFQGYSEGWAMYVELLSYETAKNIAENLGDKQLTESYIDLCRLSREIQLCVLCILDIRVHDEGAQINDITPLLARIGIKDPDTIEHVYSYLVNEPGTYPKYYCGYLELIECKELYQEKCRKDGKEYAAKDFHTFFLSHGPDTYPAIRQAITGK